MKDNEQRLLGNESVMMPDSLVQPLFNGALDIVGDVHGEIEALLSLMHHLGYGDTGVHPTNRRLVFVGDLTDRGPDSPAVVDLVNDLVNAGRAQCVLGNHDLNILLGDRKHDNHWFFGEEWSLDSSNEFTPAKLADDDTRRRVLELLSALPLVLERDDLRVVHACWDDDLVKDARAADDAVTLYRRHVKLIDARLDNLHFDDIDRGLEHQNCNPVKVLTSGKERRVTTPFEASGKLRYEERVQWWHDYDAEQFCVFGHYSFFEGVSNSSGRAICIDYAVAKRWMERKAPNFDGTFKAKLAALRFPEMTLMFDVGETKPVANHSQMTES